jgi:hypothetical protein
MHSQQPHLINTNPSTSLKKIFNILSTLWWGQVRLQKKKKRVREGLGARALDGDSQQLGTAHEYWVLSAVAHGWQGGKALLHPSKQRKGHREVKPSTGSQ